jgi:hypothetical protein
LTSFAGHLFLDAHKVFQSVKYLQYADEVALYFVKEHPQTKYKQGLYFHYDPNITSVIYNASACISSFLLRHGNIANKPISLKQGFSGIQFIIHNQNPDGSWYYGRSKKHRYIDGFHTAFNLLSIMQIKNTTSNEQYFSCLEKGLNFYKTALFQKTGHSKIKPVRYVKSFTPYNSNIIIKSDLRDAALGMILFEKCKNILPEERTNSYMILEWVRKKLSNKTSGTFYPFHSLFGVTKIPYINYQAWMLLALSTIHRRK